MKLSELFEGKTVWPNAIVIKNTRGRTIGEIYQIESGPLKGEWGNFHYGLDDGEESFETQDEAFEALSELNDEYINTKKLVKSPLVKIS